MKDQIAVVTGGAQGIGLAVARLLAEQGARRLAKRRFAPAFPISAFPIIES